MYAATAIQTKNSLSIPPISSPAGEFGCKQEGGGGGGTPSHLLKLPLSVRELREPSEPW